MLKGSKILFIVHKTFTKQNIFIINNTIMHVHWEIESKPTKVSDQNEIGAQGTESSNNNGQIEEFGRNNTKTLEYCTLVGDRSYWLDESFLKIGPR